MKNPIPMMTPEEICRLFTETALKPDKCIDFDIKHWIEKYDLIRKEPRFAEIAMLIMSAAQIYGRKVDYVEEFILNLCKAFKSVENDGNKDGPNAIEAALDMMPENRPRRRTKRMRPEMLSEKLIRTEYVVKASKIVGLAKVTEKLSMSLLDEKEGGKAKPIKRSLKQDILQWKINFPDETGKTKPRPQKLKIEEEELYSRYTNFGKSYLYDYENEDVLGVKKDFKVFAGYIDPSTNGLLSDLNLRKFYKLQEEAEAEPFDEEDMNQECDFLEDTRGGSPCRNDTAFFSDCPSMEVDSAIGSITADSETNMLSQSTIDSQNSSLDETKEDSVANTSQSTEMNSSSGAEQSSIDTSSRVIPQMMMKSTIITKVEPELKLNFLGLPAKMLRKKMIFSLPKELTKKPAKEATSPVDAASVGELIPENSDFKGESGILNLPSTNKELANKSSSLFITLNDLANLPSRPPSPISTEDEEDFIGFDETPQFNDSDVFTSTLNRLSLDSSLFLPKAPSRSMSQDSGFQSPPFSVRFSCDEAGPSDVDSGLGVSCIDDDAHANRSSMQTIAEEEDEKLEAEKRRTKEKSPEMDEAAIELTEKHKKLQAIADKRHQERLDQNLDVTVEVNKWHSYLKDILKASHARANFDIHELGTEILDSFPAAPDEAEKTITFADVVADKAQPDICRYFLSTLLLANTENIRLSVTGKNKDQVTEYKDMKMQFLTAERHYKEMEAMYDDEGAINSNVKKRMRDADDDQVAASGSNVERTPTKKKKVAHNKAIVKMLEQSPTDSGYLSGLEESSSSKSVVNRKRSSDGTIKKAVRNFFA